MLSKLRKNIWYRIIKSEGDHMQRIWLLILLMDFDLFMITITAYIRR